MKKMLTAVLGKPRIIIPVFFVLAVIAAGVSYNYIGRTPVVTIPSDSQLSVSDATSSNNVVDLAFVKAGRLASVSVTVGSSVRKGDVLASLDAGDVQGVVTQAKGALELAQAQYASLDVQYANAKTEQDTLVDNAYRTLLSDGLAAFAQSTTPDHSAMTVDSSQAPQISGTYTCGKEGSYEIDSYRSSVPSGHSFTFKGLESGSGNVAFYTPQPLGSCGLFVQFPAGYDGDNVEWVISIPNTKSSTYAANKNTYNLAISTRDQVLNQFEANLGKNGSAKANVAQAAVDSAEGAYQTALAAYKNDLIVAPADGTVTSVDPSFKAGESVAANKTVITILTK